MIIELSLVVVVILFLTSFTQVVGYQTVQSLHQSIIKERIYQREFLFQTIADIANNKEIQQIILKSQVSRGIFPTSEIPVVTKNQLKMMYFLGLILSKVVSKSKIQLIIGKYQFDNQEIQKKINAVVKNNPIIKEELTHLQNSNCDCEKNIDEEKISKIEITDYQKICGFLFIIWVTSAIIIIPFEAIFEFLKNMELILLEKLFFLITLPIWLPFILIFSISLFLFFVVFRCMGVILIE